MSRLRLTTMTLCATVALSLGSVAAQAETFEVKMLSKGEKGTMVFEPDLLQIAPGDTVKFVPADKGHNAESIEGMFPEGFEPFKGKISEEIDVTFDLEGAYGVRCKPHFGLGMVMLIIVGTPANAEAAESANVPKKAKEKFEALFDRAVAN